MTSSVLFFSSCLSHIFPLPPPYPTPSPRFSLKFHIITQKTILEGYRVQKEGFSALMCNCTTFLGATALTSGVLLTFSDICPCVHTDAFFSKLVNAIQIGLFLLLFNTVRDHVLHMMQVLPVSIHTKPIFFF